MKVESYQLVYFEMTWDLGDPIAKEFRDWYYKSELIPPCRMGGTSPNWRYMGLFPNDAKRVFAWLKEHGVDMESSFDGWERGEDGREWLTTN